MRYHFISRTTLDFTRLRIERDGFRLALVMLAQDLQHVRRGGKLYDHRLPKD